MAVRTVSFRSQDGLLLEGRLAVPQQPLRGAAVLCHPTAPTGGLMPNVLMPSVQRSLQAAGWASLRFNYRGVGRSQGPVSSDVDSIADVGGALAFLSQTFPGLARALVGWSSGSTIALWACAAEPAVAAFIGISLPVSAPSVPSMPDPRLFSEWRGRMLLIAGEDDPACRPEDVKALASAFGADLEVLEGADHALNGRLDALGALVTWFLR